MPNVRRKRVGELDIRWLKPEWIRGEVNIPIKPFAVLGYTPKNDRSILVNNSKILKNHKIKNQKKLIINDFIILFLSSSSIKFKKSAINLIVIKHNNKVNYKKYDIPIS